MIPFIVVAGGLGKRFGSIEPKQYFLIDGKPILYYTVETLINIGVKECILVLDPIYEERTRGFLEPLTPNIEIKYAKSGESRQNSVKNGLNLLPEGTKLVAIHDGVRPFISKKLVKRLLFEIKKGQCAIPVTCLKDTIKKIKSNRVVKTLNRNFLYAAGTPQIVDLDFYKKALQKMNNYKMVDDALLIEATGGKVITVPNDEENIKITTPFDLIIIKEILRRKQ